MSANPSSEQEKPAPSPTPSPEISGDKAKAGPSSGTDAAVDERGQRSGAIREDGGEASVETPATEAAAPEPGSPDGAAGEPDLEQQPPPAEPGDPAPESRDAQEAGDAPAAGKPVEDPEGGEDSPKGPREVDLDTEKAELLDRVQKLVPSQLEELTVHCLGGGRRHLRSGTPTEKAIDFIDMVSQKGEEALKRLGSKLTELIGRPHFKDAPEGSALRDEYPIDLTQQTVSLPAKPPELPGVPESSKLTELRSVLWERRFAIVTCYDRDIALSAAYRLVETCPGDALLLQIPNQFRSDEDDEQITLGRLLDSCVTLPHESIIVVDITRAHGTVEEALLRPAVDLMNASILTRRAEQAAVRLVFVALLDRLANDRRYQDSPAMWRLDYLAPLLTHFVGKPRPELERELQEVLASGRWGDPRESYEMIRRFLGEGEDRLLAELQQPPENRNLDDLITARKPLHRVVLGIAAFLQDLRPSEFGHAVSLCIADATEEIVQRRVVSGKDGVDKIRIETTRRPLTERWSEEGDYILTDCRLGAMSREGGHPDVIDFTAADLRPEVRRRLEVHHSLFLNQVLDKLGSFLFHPHRRVADAFIRFAAGRVGKDGESREMWLFDLVQSVQAGDPQEGILRRPKQAWDRLGQFLLELVRKAPGSSDLVAGLLDRLLRSAQAPAAIEIVSRLSLSPDFDTLTWIERLLASSDVLCAARVERLLAAYLRANRARMSSSTKQLLAWTDRMDRPGKDRRPGTAALSATVQVWWGRLYRAPISRYGETAACLALFGGNASDPYDPSLSLLLHPEMQSACEDVLGGYIFLLLAKWFRVSGSSPEHSVLYGGVTLVPPVDQAPEPVDFFLAVVLVEARAALFGLDQKQDSSETALIWSWLLDAVRSQLPPDRQSAIRNGLAGLADFALMSQRIPGVSREQQRTLGHRRGVARNVIKDLSPGRRRRGDRGSS